MRLVLIGAGRWAERHARTIADTSGVTLDTVVSTQSVKRAFGARQWCRDMASVPWARIDGAIIASATPSHYQLACETILRGIPTLVEKPLTTTSVQSQLIRQLARKKNVLVMVALVHLFSDAFKALREQLAGQRIHIIRGVAGNAGPYRPDCNALWDYGPHDIGMALALLGGRTFRATRTIRASDLRIANVSLTKDKRGGATTHVQLTASFRMPKATFDPGLHSVEIELEFGSAMRRKARWFEAITASERFLYDDLATPKLTRTRAGIIEPIELGSGLPLGRTIQAFCHAIQARQRKHETLSLSIESCRLLERIERAVARSITPTTA